MTPPLDLAFTFRILGLIARTFRVEKDQVRTLFDGIAPRYDLLNHLLSGGIDRRWRRRAVGILGVHAGMRLLDVATGTADVAIAAAERSPRLVAGVDIAREMLAIGRRKVSARGLGGVVSLLQAEAEHLPFPEGAFDAAIVAFGARNFESLGTGLAEMHRVLRPGGRIVILEFSRPHRSPFRQIYMLYFRRLLPLIGALVSGDGAAYRYLPASVMSFPEGEEFLSLLTRTGFLRARAERLSGGIASLYTAEKRHDRPHDQGGTQS